MKRLILLLTPLLCCASPVVAGQLFPDDIFFESFDRINREMDRFFKEQIYLFERDFAHAAAAAEKKTAKVGGSEKQLSFKVNTQKATDGSTQAVIEISSLPKELKAANIKAVPTKNGFRLETVNTPYQIIIFAKDNLVEIATKDTLEKDGVVSLSSSSFAHTLPVRIDAASNKTSVDLTNGTLAITFATMQEPAQPSITVTEGKSAPAQEQVKVAAKPAPKVEQKKGSAERMK